jgi:transposase
MPPAMPALLAWADAPTPAGATRGFCLESTGAYSTALATPSAGAGRHVSSGNPACLKYAGLMRGRGNQTDQADARPIAAYAPRARPPAGQPAPAETLE